MKATVQTAARDESLGALMFDAEEALFAERHSLLAQIAAGEREFQNGGAGWDERDSPSEDTFRDIEYGRSDALRRRLAKIEAAIERLESGTYGRCLRCGNRINGRRLETDPAADLCRFCQTSLEGNLNHRTL